MKLFSKCFVYKRAGQFYHFLSIFIFGEAEFLEYVLGKTATIVKIDYPNDDDIMYYVKFENGLSACFYQCELEAV